MQFGGCHPVDGCQDGHAFAGRALPVPRGERVLRGHERDDPPAVRDREGRQREDRVHRADARGHAHDRHARRRRRTRVPARGRDGQRARREAPERAGRARRSSCSSTRAARRTRLRRCSRGRNQPDAYATSTAAPTSTARDHVDRERPRSAVNVVDQRPHASAVHLHDRRQARHERVLVRPRDHGHRPHASTTRRRTSKAKARTTIVTQDVAQDPDGDRASSRSTQRSRRPLANRIVGTISGGHPLGARHAERAERRR